MNTLTLIVFAYFLGQDIDPHAGVRYCYYDYLGATYTLTLRISDICPLQLNLGSDLDSGIGSQENDNDW